MNELNLKEMKETVLSYVKKEFIGDSNIEIDYNTPLISSGYIDSFAMVSLIVFIENTFHIEIPSNYGTPEKFDNVNNIAELVKELWRS